MTTIDGENESGTVAVQLSLLNAGNKEQLNRDSTLTRRRQFGALGHQLNGVGQFARFKDEGSPLLALVLHYHSYAPNTRYEEYWTLVNIDSDGSISIGSIQSDLQTIMDTLLGEGEGEGV